MRSIRIHAAVAASMVVLLALPVRSGGNTIWVSTEGSDLLGDGSQALPFRTITNAFQLAFDGDTIRVLPGTYDECVFATSQTVMELRAVSIVADDWIAGVPPDNTTTIIDGGGFCEFPDSVVNISGHDPANPARLEGFTVTGGLASGVFAQGSVTITNNVITGNSSVLGGGIYFYNSGCIYGDTVTTFSNNVISDNTSAYDDVIGFGGDGGGLYVLARAGSPSPTCLDGNATVNVTSNVIDSNVSTNPVEDATGGGLWVFSTSAAANSTSNVVITQNTITGNSIAPDSAGYGGGAWVAIFGIASGYGIGVDSVMVQDNDITGNSATNDGGGISAWVLMEDNSRATLRLEGNDVSNNVAGGDGGGMDLYLEANDILNDPSQHVRLLATNNTIADNAASGRQVGGGGVIATMLTRLTSENTIGELDFLLEGNTITGNDCALAGGGVSTWPAADGDPNVGGVMGETSARVLLRQNLIAQNNDDEPDPGPGGGIFAYHEAYGPATATTEVVLSTVADNRAAVGAGGIEIEEFSEFSAGGATLGLNRVVVNSSVISGNEGWGIGGPGDGVPGIGQSGGGEFNLELDVDFSVIGANGSGAVETSMPQDMLAFVDADPLLDDDYLALTCSPTIDGGDPTLAFSMEPAPNGGRVNAGHTGNTADASRSLADLNGDDLVDGIDLLRLSTAFDAVVGQLRYLPAADLDASGQVDGVDLAILASDYGIVCP